MGGGADEEIPIERKLLADASYDRPTVYIQNGDGVTSRLGTGPRIWRNYKICILCAPNSPEQRSIGLCSY